MIQWDMNGIYPLVLADVVEELKVMRHGTPSLMELDTSSAELGSQNVPDAKNHEKLQIDLSLRM